MKMSRHTVRERSNDGNSPELVKYDSIAHIDEALDLGPILRDSQVEVFEKVDGGNCQVSCHNYQLYPGSRANFLRGPVIGRRRWFRNFVDWSYANASLYDLPPNLILFGEWTEDHVIDYDPEFAAKFFMIDLFDREQRRFVPYVEAVDLLGKLGVGKVNFLEPLARGDVSEAVVWDLLDQPSLYYPGPKEGLVLKAYDTDPQKLWKILHPDFEEKRARKLGPSGKGAKTGLPSGIFHANQMPKYLTPMRIMKAAHRLLDEGRASITRDELVAEVRRDVKEERGLDYKPETVRRGFDAYKRDGKLKPVAKYIQNGCR